MIRIILVVILLRFLACIGSTDSNDVQGKEVPDYIDEVEMENYA